MKKDKIEKMIDKRNRTVDVLTIKLSEKLTLEYEITIWDQGWMLMIDEDHGSGITDTTALALIQATNGSKTKISHSSRLMADDELSERKDYSTITE